MVRFNKFWGWVALHNGPDSFIGIPVDSVSCLTSDERLALARSRQADVRQFYRMTREC